MKHRRVFAFALILLVFCGCGPGEPAQHEATLPPGQESTAPGPTTSAPAQTDPPQTDPPPAPPGPVNKIDDSQLTKNNLSVQQIFVCDDDTVLFFVSPVNPDGTVSESIIIYSYSFKLGGFRAATYYAGIVNLFPEYVFDDGSVALVTLDSESYEFDSLIFLDTVTLSAQKHPLPSDDFYNLHISPDKRYAAISTYDYLLIADLSYSDEYLRLERRAVPMDDLYGEEEPWQDELVCSATGWSAGSDVLFFKTMGWGDAYSPGLVRAGTWEVVYIDELSGSIMVPMGGRAFYYSAFSSLPAGTVDLQSGIASTPNYYNGGEYSNGITADSGENYVCVLSVSETEGGDAYQCVATVSRIDGGEYVNSLEIARDGDIVSFEQAFFTPSGDRLVLVVSGTLNYSRAVYTFDFLMK